MNPGVRYGLLVVAPLMALLTLAPQPLGSAVAFGVIAAQGVYGAVLVWRRTGLKYATASLITGAVGAALMAYLFARGVDVWALSPASMLALFLMVGGIVLFVIEERVSPDKWQAWREFMADKSVPDILRGRHIPHLR